MELMVYGGRWIAVENVLLVVGSWWCEVGVVWALVFVLVLLWYGVCVLLESKDVRCLYFAVKKSKVTPNNCRHYYHLYYLHYYHH